MFSVIRLAYVDFFIGKILQVFYFPSNAVVKTGNLEEEFLKSFFSLQSLETMTQFHFKSHVGNETRLKKLTEVSDFGKFICNIFVWDTVKIGIITAKVQFSIWI